MFDENGRYTDGHWLWVMDMCFEHHAAPESNKSDKAVPRHAQSEVFVTVIRIADKELHNGGIRKYRYFFQDDIVHFSPDRPPPPKHEHADISAGIGFLNEVACLRET